MEVLTINMLRAAVLVVLNGGGQGLPGDEILRSTKVLSFDEKITPSYTFSDTLTLEELSPLNSALYNLSKDSDVKTVRVFGRLSKEDTRKRAIENMRFVYKLEKKQLEYVSYL